MNLNTVYVMGLWEVQILSKCNKKHFYYFLFDECFSHLDPFGTAVNYLDAAFRNVRNLGIISVTSTDTGSLYAKSPNVTLRHYGCHIVRTEYYRELAARMVVATVAR